MAGCRCRATAARRGCRELDPRGRMVAGIGLAPDLAVDTGIAQAAGEVGAEQQVIEAQAGVARPAVSHVMPEGIHRLLRMTGPDRGGPALSDQLFKGGG